MILDTSSSETKEKELSMVLIVLMEFQSLRGFEEEEAIRDALKCFLAAIIAE